MAGDIALRVHERLEAVFQELGLDKAHIAARDAGDWQGFFDADPDRFASLALLCPIALDPERAAKLGERLLVIAGDHGAAAGRVQQALVAANGVSTSVLRDYDGLMWSDVAADHDVEVNLALLAFLRRIEGGKTLSAAGLAEDEGEAAGISYRIRGS